MTSVGDTQKKFYYLVALDTFSDDPMFVLFLNVKERWGSPRLTTNLFDWFIASRTLVMVEWVAHPTSNQGDAGSIPTHGSDFFFHSKNKSN